MEECPCCGATVPRLTQCGLCEECTTPAVDWQRLREAFLSTLDPDEVVYIGPETAAAELRATAARMERLAKECGDA